VTDSARGLSVLPVEKDEQLHLEALEAASGSAGWLRQKRDAVCEVELLHGAKVLGEVSP
jgi:hypothetical protein